MHIPLTLHLHRLFSSLMNGRIGHLAALKLSNLSVAFGSVADPDVSNLSVRFSATLFVGLQMYTARIGQKLN
jgi:hypothetical protein